MDTKEFIAEHRKLVPILKSGSKAVRLKEANKQHKELLEYMKSKKIKFEKTEKGHGKKHEKAEVKKYGKNVEKMEHKKPVKKGKK